MVPRNFRDNCNNGGSHSTPSFFMPKQVDVEVMEGFADSISLIFISHSRPRPSVRTPPLYQYALPFVCHASLERPNTGLYANFWYPVRQRDTALEVQEDPGRPNQSTPFDYTTTK